VFSGISFIITDQAPKIELASILRTTPTTEVAPIETLSPIIGQLNSFLHYLLLYCI